MTRRLVPVLLAALVLLSGCTGAFDTGATDDATPTPEALDPSEADLPPGVTENGVENASALVAAHNETVLAEGFVMNGSGTTNGSTFGNRTSTTHRVVGPNAETFTVDLRTTVHEGPVYDSPYGDEVRQRIWADETVVARVDHGNETRYNNLEALRSRVGASQAQTFERYLDAGAFSVEQTLAYENRTLTTLVADDTRDDAEEFNVSAFDARFVVDERGVVHEADVDYTLNGSDYRQRVEYRLVELGVSPDEPEWVSEVPDAVHRNVSVDADVEYSHDTGAPAYLNVTNEGPDAMPTGVELNVTTNEAGYEEPPRTDTLNAVLAVDAPLESGDSVYVYRTDDSLELTRDESVAASGDGIRSDVSVAISADGVSFGSFGMGWGSESATESASSGESGSAGGSSSGGSATSTTTAGDV